MLVGTVPSPIRALITGSLLIRHSAPRSEETPRQHAVGGGSQCAVAQLPGGRP
jgi:hypothetical protein